MSQTRTIKLNRSQLLHQPPQQVQMHRTHSFNKQVRNNLHHKVLAVQASINPNLPTEATRRATRSAVTTQGRISTHRDDLAIRISPTHNLTTPYLVSRAQQNSQLVV